MIWKAGMLQLLLGLGLSALIGGLGYRSGSLARSGVLGAILTGTLIFGLGGVVWGGLLVLFFVSSSLLSHWQEARKTNVADVFAKGGQRDLSQALANGGIGAALALANWLTPHPLWLAAFVGTMAAVTADTWATEIGVLSSRPPRLITTFKPVPPGTSGGITLLGTGAALAGGVFIGLSAALLQTFVSFPRLPFLPLSTGATLGASTLILAGAVAGLLSALFDSLLGATVERIYLCEVCGKETERRVHHNRPTRPLRGWPWLDNDGVNFLASLVGALLGAGIGRLL
jgi:uncharacterized protein (TIGR00297 family)